MRRLAPLLVVATTSAVVGVAGAQPAPTGGAPAAPTLEELAEQNRALLRRLDALEAEVGRLREAPRPAPSPPITPTPAEPEAPLDPFDDSSPIHVAILGELDYRVYPSEVEGNDGFAIARLRPGVVLTPADWFRAVATIELASEYATILDAYATMRATPWLEVVLGYSKPPLFATYVREPDHTLPFPDHSSVVTSFRVRRDLGAEARLAPREVPLEASVRVGNGTGSPLGNDNPVPAGYASLDLVLGRAWVGADPDARTYGLRLGASGLIESARDRDGVIGQTPFGFVYFRPVVVSGLRAVAEGHLVGYAGPVRLTVETAMARESRAKDDDGNPETDPVSLDPVWSYGVASEVAVSILGRPREVGRAPRARSGEGWTGGALEVAARYDGLWLARGAGDVKAGGAHTGELALKWWPVGFFATSLSGYSMRYDVAPIEAPDDRTSWGFNTRASFFWGQAGHANAPPESRTADPR